MCSLLPYSQVSGLSEKVKLLPRRFGFCWIDFVPKTDGKYKISDSPYAEKLLVFAKTHNQ